MKIELNIGDTFIIPIGCKATIKDNKIVIEKEQEEFKHGDILHSTQTDRMLIFKRYRGENNYYLEDYYNTTDSSTSEDLFASKFRLATKEEKRAFFNELKAKGLRWNAETREMERVRKRVKKGEKYLYINQGGLIIETTDCTPIDDANYLVGNYYLLSEAKEAEEDAKVIKAIFEKRIKIK